ncbi:hypothetical protein HanIR_Chr12g0594591 [Helianthus annuus]|nr:hypothetical protein HanIR_Chr12g0594591 [Helianthus annuus]
MMRNAFNIQPVQPFQPEPKPTQPTRSDPNEEVEVVPETQPQKGKRRKGKQVAGEQPSKPKAKPWTQLEEEALAKAYIGTFTHPIKGNNQTGEGFCKGGFGEVP